MTRRLYKTRVTLWVLAILALAGTGYFAWRMAQVGAAYKAKNLCSGIFISGRDPASLEKEEQNRARFIKAQIDRSAKTVSAGLAGLIERTALYRPGLGATLAIGASAETLKAQKTGFLSPRPTREYPWPLGDRDAGPKPAPGMDRTRLQAALEMAFQDPNPKRPKHTRAVLVIHRGRLIAERYAPGFDRDTPLPGHSLAKSVTSVLAGILVGQDKLHLSQPLGLAEWRDKRDHRRSITLDHLLTMSSGMAWDENYTSVFSHVAQMLYNSGDTAGFAADQPFQIKPGLKWQYSSAGTNIICLAMRRAFTSQADYLAFPRRALFDMIGMQGAVLEVDAAGTFVGSSFMYACARDWARFGMLCLQDGIWQGQPILPPGWMKYCRTPAPAAPRGKYGAHFWLNRGSGSQGEDRVWPHLPRDAFWAQGYKGQYITMIPSRELVLVRLGAKSGIYRPGDQQDLIASVLAALPD